MPPDEIIDTLRLLTLRRDDHTARSYERGESNEDDFRELTPLGPRQVVGLSTLVTRTTCFQPLAADHPALRGTNPK
jgi:hypothetical protein